ncbi:MAG TPA: UDP-N-acetylmuramoyl-tripeptide--D-alanyl-D-alanine ligase [Candidatus Saccharimonadales bacterium]|nr:UDP-N-acetylmuramoyl-tripeptide--D-alanyl-D-alanine ligase [Candidatus Saccharimonadales bacterium]
MPKIRRPRLKNLARPFFHTSRRLLAKLWLQSHSKTTVIGVTGSYGKTNTVAAIDSVLSEKFKTLTTDVNLDTNYNIPITILKLTSQEKLILEYGIDHLGEMDRHLFLANPQIAVVTGISPVHADKEHLGSLENIIREKSKLVHSVSKDGFAILNYDVVEVRRMADQCKGKVLFYGLDKDRCQVWANRISLGLGGLEFNLHYKDQMVKVKTGLVGSQFVYNCLAAAAVGIVSGMDLSLIAHGLGNLKPMEGRMSLESGPRGSVILNDSRRASPASTIAGLQTLEEYPAKRKIAVLGEMGELGEWEEKGHREVGKEVVEVKPDYLIAVGPLTKYIVKEAEPRLKKGTVIWVSDVFEAAGVLSSIIKTGDLIYLKGSLLKHLERIPLIMEGKAVDHDEVASHRYEVYR